MSPATGKSSTKLRGPWRSLEQLQDSPEFRKIAGDEFLPGAMDYTDGAVSRRNFLKLVSASMAAAGLTACSKKADENIVPYVNQPAAVIPGRPRFFATAMTLAGYAQGVLATSREGRPIKIEGNPDHPASLGATDVFMQASILDLYDPDRAKTITRAGDISDWDSFIAALRPRLSRATNENSGLAILTETVTSPTLLKQISDIKKIYPGTRWFGHNPVDRGNIRAGLRNATGQEILPIYDFSKAKVVVSLDCDFLAEEPGHLRYARDFADARRFSTGSTTLNRLYILESTHTITGSVADHRWPMRPSAIAGAAKELMGAIDNPAGATGWAKAVADDLLANRGAGLLLAGAHQPPAVHALVHEINDRLQNIHATVKYLPPVEGDPDGNLADLVREMNGGSIHTLFILGGNPVYSAPSDLDFDNQLEIFSKKLDARGSLANLTVHLGPYDDETSFKCQWHLPQTHFLEEWSDARAYDGTVALVQPLIDPLYAGRSSIEVLEILRAGDLRAGYDIVREFWHTHHNHPDFDQVWDTALQKGIWATPVQNQPVTRRITEAAPLSPPAINVSDRFDLVLRPDPCVWDGSFSNNAFLQELPKPLTKLTWDNAALISSASAASLGVSNGDVLHIATESAALDVPAWILPGQPDNTLTLHLGYGRWRGGTVLAGAGFNAYKFRTTQHPSIITGVQVSRTDDKYLLVATHTHQTIDTRQVGDLDAKVTEHPGDHELDNRKLLRVATLQQFKDNPDFVKQLDDGDRHSLTLYPGYDDVYKKNFAWGMSIDMQTCIGCNACVLACQTENNSPVVGKDQVSRGREMHWIRIDTYYEGPAESPSRAFHQPIPCMQCENAPCELVCPVGATVHDNEGINNMVYNRCVGTRYCSNNCPYQVRRFNFLQYADDTTESLKLMRNPEVTVRNRGVMEKCNYCIQRIVATRIDIEDTQVQMEDQARSAGDPDVSSTILRKSAKQRQQILEKLQTACQQACPTQAIVFGNLNPLLDPMHELNPEGISNVARLKNSPLTYSLLAELTTKPRTTYLARITNPNPAVSPEDSPA